MYFERFSAVLERFPKTSFVKHFLITKASFLRKRTLTLTIGIFSISETNKIRDNMISIRHISINFDRKCNGKKVIIHFFLGTKRRKRETYYRYFTFELMVVSSEDLKGELVLKTTTVVVTKVCSFS